MRLTAKYDFDVTRLKKVIECVKEESIREENCK
jgi:hypothetical protein